MYFLMTTTLSLMYSIIEEEPRGTFIGNIYRDTAHKNAQIFLTNAAKNINSSLLHFDQQTGILTSNSRLDREKICPHLTRNQLCLLKIHFDNITIDLLVIDKNDHAPIFGREIYEIKILKILGAKIYPIPVARDLDQNFGISYYKLNTTKNFYLINSTKLKIPYLVFAGDLEGKKKNEFFLKLFAFDKGFPPKFGFTTLHIIFIKNITKFERKNYYFTLNSSTSTEVGKVRAINSKKSQNGLKYSISVKTLWYFRDVFTLDQKTGIIKLINGSDPQIDRYVLIVSVSDKFDEKWCDTTRVTINLNFVKIRATTILVNHQKIKLSPTPTTLAYFVIYQNLTKSLGHMQCRAENPSTVRIIYNLRLREYIVVTDSITNPSFTVRVECCGDSGEKAGFGLLFDISAEILYVRENCAVGCFIGRLESQRNSSHINELVEIDGQGRVYAKVVFDRELCPLHDVSYGENRLRLVVRDVNDNPPMFEQKKYSFTVSNYSVGYLGVVVARDGDEFPNNVTEYSVENVWSSLRENVSIRVDRGSIYCVGCDDVASGVVEFDVVAVDEADRGLRDVVRVRVERVDRDCNLVGGNYVCEKAGVMAGVVVAVVVVVGAVGVVGLVMMRRKGKRRNLIFLRQDEYVQLRDRVKYGGRRMVNCGR